MKVYVVSWHVPDDEDTTQVVGVCTSKDLADKKISDHKAEMAEMFDNADPGAIDLLPDSYSIEEHDLVTE